MGIGDGFAPERLFRRHITEMRVYASDLERVLGTDSPIVQRVRSCADECTDALDRIASRERLSK
jgi:hypothetical protein